LNRQAVKPVTHIVRIDGKNRAFKGSWTAWRRLALLEVPAEPLAPAAREHATLELKGDRER
jgi:hypothetical protein